jgi:hypothetical protein
MPVSQVKPLFKHWRSESQDNQQGTVVPENRRLFFSNDLWALAAIVGPDKGFVCCDRLDNGWKGAPGPWGTHDVVFCVPIKAMPKPAP